MLRSVVGFVCVFGLLGSAAARPAVAQEPKPSNPSPDLKAMQQIQEDAQKLGDWDNQYRVIEDATDNIFQQQGWTSESDVWSRSVFRNVGRVSPWKPQERQKIFLDELQQRYKLTLDQRTALDGDIQREAMGVAMKHFKETLPVAMEILKTRAANQPFTAEQVQRWSKTIKPVMDDSMTAVERVVGKLDKTMTEEQRAALQGDLKAFRKRHQDMQKMVDKWQAGNWNPTDWGLQNDPIHAGAVAEYAASQAQKEKAALDEKAVALDESSWERYVRQFCDRYNCTDGQRTQADAILKKCRKEALDYLAARRAQIDKLQKPGQPTENPQAKQQAAQELERLMAPVGEIFNRMKAQLMGLLTSEQRAKFGATPPAAAPAKPAPPEQKPATPPEPKPATPPEAKPAASQPEQKPPAPTTPPASPPAPAPPPSPAPPAPPAQPTSGPSSPPPTGG